MKRRGHLSSLSDLLFFGMPLIFGCLACQQKPSQETVSVSENKITAPVPILIEGDTIKTGEAFLWKGKKILAADRPPPEVFPSKTITIPANLPKEYPLTQSDIHYWPDNLPTVTPGENGIPQAFEIPLHSDTINLPLPVRYPAWSFRRKSLSTSQFETLTMEEGLPFNLITTMIEDHKGHFWMGSELGVIHFDGKEFLLYDLTDVLDFFNAFVFMEDQQGAIWFSLTNFGRRNIGKNDAIAKFDGHKLIIYDFTKTNWPDRLNIDGAEHFTSLKITEDQNNRIWVASGFGLINLEANTCRLYTTDQGLLETPAFNVFTDNNELLWICHPDGNTSFDGKRFVHYRHNLGFSWSGTYAWRNVTMNSKGTIWVFKDQMTYAFSKNSIVSYKTPFPLHFGLADSYGNIWGTANEKTQNRSLTKLDPEGFSLTSYTAKEGLIAPFLGPLLWDSNENLWLSSEILGIQRYSPHKIRYQGFESIPEMSHITNIVEDQSQNLWFGLHHMAKTAAFDGKNYTFFDVFYSNSSSNQITRDLYLDQKDHLWMGTPGYGVYKWNKTQLLGYTPEQGLGGDEVYAITETPNGNMWFGARKGGLTKFEGDSWIQYHLESINEERNKQLDLDVNSIRALLTDRNGQVWAGSYGGGLIKFDGDFATIYTTREGLSHNMIVSLLEDKEGYIWAGTADGGVNRFNPADSILSFEAFTTKDGLSSNEVWTVTEDSVGNIWLGAGHCLNLLLRESNGKTVGSEASFRVINYCRADGLLGGEFYANSTLRDHKNQIWWGSNNSLQMLPPDVYPIQDSARVELKEINIGQTTIDFRSLADSISKGKDYWAGENNKRNFAHLDFESVATFHNYPIGLLLPHDFNHITFHFSATHHPRLDQVQFSYFIEGIDNEWSTPSKDNKAEYRGLSPGNYTFQIKAAGLEDNWGPVFFYQFTIRPPWWQSTWAYVLWILLIGMGLYSLYLYNVRRQLEKAESRRMKELDQLKSHLYTNITHEFRTPLTVIMGMTEQLNVKAAELPKSYKEKITGGLSLIQRNGHNLLHLINQLLDLSKLDSGKLKLKLVQGDIVVYLQYLTESFYSMAEDKGIRLTFYSEEESLLMDYDEEKIQQIVYNLLSNAIKFTPEKGKIILHLLKQQNLGSDQLQMKVKDTGVGMNPKEVQHVFDRFYQADGSSTRKGEGTGIGLALTKELVELMKGKIKVESNPGKGSTFFIQLPINQEAPLQQNISTGQIQAGTSISTVGIENLSSSTISGKNPDAPSLLIIEDNADVAIYIKELLNGAYNIYMAENGQIGIDQAIELVPDIIISDVMMPEKDGFEVCATLKQDERTSHIPIILLTARAGQEDLIEGLQHGADAYLTKPFQKQELLVRLKKLVELRHILQERFSTSPDGPLATPTPNDKEAKFLQKLREKVIEQMDNPDFGVPQLAQRVFMSQIQVYRKLKALTGQTPSQFIRSIRLQKAKELLKDTEMSIAEIAYEVGYSDPNYFSRTFQSEFKSSPRDFRK